MRQPKPKADKGADLDVLHPNREAVIAGRKVTLREYGFVEGLRLRPLTKPFTDDLYAVFFNGIVPDYEQVLDIIGRHADTVMELAAKSADVEVEWVRTLSHADGDLLLLLWWGANSHFFIQNLLRRSGIEQEVARLQRLAGATSTPHSLPTTTTQSSSATTPSAS
ncbi:MAG: DUF6631 family protein [Collimonas sp.]